MFVWNSFSAQKEKALYLEMIFIQGSFSNTVSISFSALMHSDSAMSHLGFKYILIPIYKVMLS